MQRNGVASIAQEARAVASLDVRYMRHGVGRLGRGGGRGRCGVGRWVGPVVWQAGDETRNLSQCQPFTLPALPTKRERAQSKDRE